MTPEQRAELTELLKQLSPAEKRVLRYEANGGHDCNRSTNLTTCCDVSRCPACHVPHLRQVHGEAAVMAYEKFVMARSLTWQVRAYKMPLKQPKVNTRTRLARAPQVKESPQSLASRIADNDLERVLALLESKLRKS